MFNLFKDFTDSFDSFILKIEYSDGEIMLLRYRSWNEGLQFSNLVSSYFGSEVKMSYMTEEFFKQYAEDFQHPEWLDLIQDVEEDAKVQL